MPERDIKTFGCRLNISESRQIEELANNAGLENVAIFNSCGVTNEAVRQVRQSIRKTRREQPDKKIIVTGCAAQMHPEMFDQMDEIDHVVGNGEKLKPETYQSLAKKDAHRMHVSDIMALEETAEHMMSAYAERTRAFLEIQNGCDHRCTFCIIPFGRGPSRSVAASLIIKEARKLLDQGILEIVLTGVDLTDYQNPETNQSGHSHHGLGWLVGKILEEIPELPRLRISSLDVIELDEPFLDVLSDERVMPHLHLSLQAGDDMILKRMKRRHLRDDGIRLCEQIRSRRPDMVLGADLIAGFPTETDEMFENTLKAVDECELTFLHVFPFSPREGTPAARMPQLERPLIKERARILREKGDKTLSRHLLSKLGKTAMVLCEKDGRGRSPWFSEVDLTGNEIKPGHILPVRFTDIQENRLRGKVTPDA